MLLKKWSFDFLHDYKRAPHSHYHNVNKMSFLILKCKKKYWTVCIWKTLLSIVIYNAFKLNIYGIPRFQTHNLGFASAMHYK